MSTRHATSVRVKYIKDFHIFYFMEKRKIDLLQFVPKIVKCGKKEKEYKLDVKEGENYIMLSYQTDMSNHLGINAKREYPLTIPKYIIRNKETFEVLGLLQAEMGKTNNGCIIFANTECRLVNNVMKWFKKELEIDYEIWRWYIKINLNLSKNHKLKNVLKEELIEYWVSKTKIDCEKRHPTTLTDIKNTLNEIPKNYGALIIEYKSNLLSQIIKNFVKTISYQMPNFEKEETKAFMRGILAGESCVEVNRKHKRYMIHLSADKEIERILYRDCLRKLGISCNLYKNYKDITISKKKNNLELLKQRLMTLHPKKYNKFLYMMKLYNGNEVNEWSKQFKGKAYNKIPKEVEDRIIQLKKSYPDWPAWKIAKLVSVSEIKVCRVLKANNLGKRLEKTSQETINKIIEIHSKDPSLHAYQIAEMLEIHKSRVERVRRKYGLKKFAFKTPKEKIGRIIQIYKDNPIVKVKDICKELGVSDSVVKLVRRKYRIKHLGYKHLIGCNNQRKKSPTFSYR